MGGKGARGRLKFKLNSGGEGWEGGTL
jgi:hypothetical protein